MGQLQSWMAQEIKAELERQGPSGLLIWYDPGGSLASLLPAALPEGVQLLRFQGSYLALRFALESEDPAFEKRWVVYVPEEPLEESWLRDWELLGKRWAMDLLELLQRKAGLAATPRLMRLLREKPANARDLAESWEQLLRGRQVAQSTLEDALLALACGLTHWQLSDVLLQFMAREVERRHFEARGLWDLLCEKVGQACGWAQVPAEEEELRRALQAASLLSELVQALPEEASRLGEVLPPQTNRPFLVPLAARWRDRQSWQDAYVEASEAVAAEYGLAGHLTASETLLSNETFAIVDRLWRQEVSRAVAPDGANCGAEAQRLGEIAEVRRKLFWARQGQAPYWEPMALASQLYLGSQQATEAAEGLATADELAQSYSADEGWWRLDLWALRLAATASALSPQERQRFVRPAYQAYARCLDQVNRRFARAVERERWQPTQPRFWSNYVVGKQRCVVFLVDALRYDLARYLANQLPGSEFKINLGMATAVLPTTTELGMAALLPTAHEGLEVAVESDALQVSISRARVGHTLARRDFLLDRLGEKGRLTTLEEVDSSDWEGVEVLVVQAGEPDRFGTGAADIYPQGLLAMVDKIAQAMRYLQERGFSTQVVSTDHGFLFLPEGVELRTLQAPEAQILKDRYAVGANPEPEGCAALAAHELGLRGEARFVFPVGLAAFGIQGGTGAFLHRGLSLQECVVPVLVAEAEAPREKVTVRMIVPDRLTSRLALVQLKAEAPTLFAQPRRVVLELGARRSEPAELSVHRPEAVVRVNWLGFDEAVPAEVRVRLLDAHSGQVLQEQRVRVEIVV